MHFLETLEHGKWSPVLKNSQVDWLERVKAKLESSGYECRIV